VADDRPQIGYPPRPTFLVRRMLEWIGDATPAETFAPADAGSYLNSLIPSGEVVERFWVELEPLVLALTLAGYECPEVIVVRTDRPAEYIRLRACGRLAPKGEPETLTEHVAESWSAVVGVDASDLGGAYGAAFLHVTVRRTLDTPVRRATQTPVPPRFPPVPLQGRVAAYRARQDAADPFADPADGWIDFTLTTPNVFDPLRTPGQLGPPAREARDVVVDALVDAWAAQAGGTEPADVGIVRCLDPATWDSALDRPAWVWPFDVVAGEIWAAAAAGGWSSLRTLLKCAADEPAASIQVLGTGRSAPLWQAIDALRSRSQTLGSGDESLDVLLEALGAPLGTSGHPDDPRHWVLTLFALHEYGLIRVLPFPLDHARAIPFVDLTGWYETSDRIAGKPVNASMQLNQAGDRLIGWLQDGQLERWDIDAQLVAPGDSQTLTYAVAYTHRGQPQEGTIDLVPRVDLDELGLRANVVSTSGTTTTTYVLKRLHRHALLPPAVVKAALGVSGVSGIETQITPLHSSVPDVIQRAGTLIVAKVAELAPALSTGNWSIGINTLEQNLRQLLDGAGVVRFAFEDVDTDGNPSTPAEQMQLAQPSPMLERFRNEIAGRLRSTQVTTGADGDAWTQLRRIMTTLEQDPHPLPSVHQLATLLALDPMAHLYEWLMGEVGPQIDLELLVGLGYGAGVVPTLIKHSSECAPNGGPHGWADLYGGLFGAGEFELAEEIGGQASFITISTSNTMTSPLDWGPDDFAPSFFVIGETSPWGGVYTGIPGVLTFGPGLRGGWEYEEYAFYGRRGWATGRGDGWVVSAGAAVAKGLYSPLGFGWTVAGLKAGALLARVGLAQPTPPPPPPPPPPAPTSAALTLERTTSFSFDQSGLTLPAQHDLAEIVARHRQIFEWPYAVIEIEGDASTPGDGSYNDRLSWERVLSVWAFIRSLLSVDASYDWAPGNALAVRDSQVELVAFGETRHRRAAQADGTERADWQRCKLVIDGRVMVIV
jgi:outer membrane protein OmpA-like peptidoglycan-associated protein